MRILCFHHTQLGRLSNILFIFLPLARCGKTDASPITALPGSSFSRLNRMLTPTDINLG